MRSIEWYVGSIANDHRLPITPHFLHFAPPFMTLYKMCAPRDFELGILADHSKSQPSDNKKLSYRIAQRDRASTLCQWKSNPLRQHGTKVSFEEICNRHMTFKVIGVGLTR